MAFVLVAWKLRGRRDQERIRAREGCMMHLYCSCGHPIVAVARWDGHDFSISLHDEAERADRDSIHACPECGRDIRLGSLRHRPPLGADWLLSRDTEGRVPQYAS